MKLILTASVEKLGEPGDIVEVKDGYGRNYLLPRNFAIKWSKGAEAQIDGIKRAKAAREVRDLDHAKEIRSQLEGLEVQVPVRTSANGKMFGAVTVADIAVAVKKAGGPALDKRSMSLPKPIKSTGTHQVAVALHDAVTAHVPVTVVAAAEKQATTTK